MRTKLMVLTLFVLSLLIRDEKAIADTNKTYIVFQAGFASCSKDIFLDPKGSGVFKPMGYLLKGLKKEGIDFEYSTSCFTADAESKVVRYYLKDVKSELRSDHPAVYSENLAASIKASGAKKLVIISHSHGAWLAMKQIVHDKFKNLEILLVSLDAISMKNCSPPVFVRNLFLNIPPAGPLVTECTEFPTDFNLRDLKKIRKETHRWINIYQDDYYYIQSSKNIFADRNYNFDIKFNILSNQHADQPYNKMIHGLVYKNIKALYKTKELR